MVSSGDTQPDNFTASIVLKATAGLRALDHGRTVHGFIQKRDEIGRDMFMGSALIELYSKCGVMEEASRVFEEFFVPDIVLWTSMITGYEQNGEPEEALRLFSRMVMENRSKPTRVTLVSVVSACARLSSFTLGRSVHAFGIRRGLDSDLWVANSLLNLYSKTDRAKYAVRLFRELPERDVVSWSSVIACCALNGAASEALALFHEMLGENIEPNSVTVVSALQACAILCNAEEGRKIHEFSVRKGFETDVSVSTALIDMYMKCFAPEKAEELFERAPKKDVVAFSAMMSGFTHNGIASRSVEVFRSMLSSEIKPDAVSTVKILSACSNLGVLDQARCFHCYAKKLGFDDNIFVGASLVELYSKCGSLYNAVEIFEAIEEKDVYVWCAMIEAYSVHGLGEKAIDLFDRMVKNSFCRPNNVTFLSVLSACRHSGLVEKGIEIFNVMTSEYHLTPDFDHHAIMVDLLGRSGDLDKAIEFINKMSFPDEPRVWGALLGACGIHHNVELGEIAAEKLFRLDSNHAGYYKLLSNIYAVDGQWESAAKLRSRIKDKNMRWTSGKSLFGTIDLVPNC